jgi:hypothetical protein
MEVVDLVDHLRPTVLRLHKIVTQINTLKNNSLTKLLAYLDSKVACCKVVFDLHYFAYWRQKQLPPSFTAAVEYLISSMLVG